MSVLGVPAQPVDATQALNLSAGVSNCKVSRGPVAGRCSLSTRADIRAFAETARGIPRSFAGTETFEQSRRERKNIEMRFAREALSKARST